MKEYIYGLIATPWGGMIFGGVITLLVALIFYFLADRSMKKTIRELRLVVNSLKEDLLIINKNSNILSRYLEIVSKDETHNFNRDEKGNLSGINANVVLSARAKATAGMRPAEITIGDSKEDAK